MADQGVDVNLCAPSTRRTKSGARSCTATSGTRSGRATSSFIPIVERATDATLPVADAGWGTAGKEVRPRYVLDGSLVTRRSVTARAGDGS